MGSLYIHENALETDTAHFYTTAISEDSLRELCTEETRERLLEGAIALEDGEDVDSMEEFDALISAGETEEASYVTLDAPEKDSRITGSIHAENEGYALFMIPYEDGWELTIDGEEAELLRGDIGFLACEVPEGDHTLELTFHAPGLMEGAAGSAACWAAFAILCVTPGIKKKRKSMRRM